jgi:opacity protein-like surface antigen
MKKLLLTVILAAAASAGAFAQAKFKWAEQAFDFGTVKEGTATQHDFWFTNEGNEPIIVQNVRVTCGCTTPEWTKDPVLPGKKGKITVKYDTNGRVYSFSKTIYVVSNVKATNGTNEQELVIKGNVVTANGATLNTGTDAKPKKK